MDESEHYETLEKKRRKLYLEREKTIYYLTDIHKQLKDIEQEMYKIKTTSQSQGGE